MQVVPLPQFGLREAVAVSRGFAGWEVVDVTAALEPIVEPPPGQLVGAGLRIGLGSPPVRLLLSTEGGHWLAQTQQDRIAVHERRSEARPTFERVSPRLHEVAGKVMEGLGVQLFEPPHAAELVEVIYDNIIRAGDGWRDAADLHQVLRILSDSPGSAPFDRAEQVQVGFAYLLVDEQQFRGRLRVVAEPHVVPGEQPGIRLKLICRRLVGADDLDLVLERSHADIVKAFTAVTTSRMHELWGRRR